MEMNTMEDWGQWVKLARENPEEFERQRAAAIEELIMSLPVESRHRSRQLQWQIDGIRLTSSNSLHACIRMYDMMMETVYGSNGLLENISLLSSRNGPSERNHTAGKAIGRSRSTGKSGLLLEFRSKKIR